MMCGYPSSGKSTRIKELKKEIEASTDYTVSIIDESILEEEKNSLYADSRKEKDGRGVLKSAIQRNISKDKIIVLDSLNYIKGFRYELYCVTKQAQTPHCVIHCDISPTVASEWNDARPEDEKYTKEIFDALVMRFEPPDSRSRWDSPLFVVQPDDVLPCKQIIDALIHRKPPPPNMSTQCQPISSTNFLHELDKITQATINVIIEAQKTCVPGDTITVPGATDKINFVRVLPLAELQRSRRQYITYSKMHPVDDCGKIANMFVQFLNNSMS